MDVINGQTYLTRGKSVEGSNKPAETPTWVEVHLNRRTGYMYMLGFGVLRCAARVCKCLMR